MTEEGARTKWCPFARAMWGRCGDEAPFIVAAEGRSVDFNDEGVPTKLQQGCIASDCMAWRWATKPVTGSPGGEVVEDRGPHVDPQFVVRTAAPVAAVVGDGYCGLAGAPQ